MRSFTLFGLGVLTLSVAIAQPYRNLANQPFATTSNGPQSLIIIDVGASGRSQEQIDRLIRQKVQRLIAAQMAAARPAIREMKAKGILPQDYKVPLFFTLAIKQDGRVMLPRGRDSSLGNGALTFKFSEVVAEQFPSDYQTFLNTLTQIVPPAIEAFYGKPAQTKQITIVNFDDQIGDRDAVAGGIYDVSNDRFLFPIYRAPESTAVNFTHLIARAFHGSVPFEYDAWEEGFARAVTVKVARSTLRNLAGLQPDFVDLTLENTYDARPNYELWNQPSLGAPTFIPPSLKQGPITGGTTGGLWLVRYLMAGSAWLKVLTEHPAFLKDFNAEYYRQYQFGATPTLGGNVPQLIGIAAFIANTVEGLPFADWYKKQYILDTSATYGRKLHAQIFPYVSPDTIQPGEALVYTAILTYFRTSALSSGIPDESLLNGTCFPVYWDSNYNRLTLSPQYERVEIRGGTGAVVPSIPDIGGQRVMTDFSVGTETIRIALPATKVQGTTFQNDFFGTVFGLNDGFVQIALENGSQIETTVVKGAFGATMPSPGVDREGRATLTFLNANREQVGTYRVNTGIGSQAVIVSLENLARNFRLILPAGVHMMSMPLRPAVADMAALLGLPAAKLLLASWRQERGDYAVYPVSPPPAPGTGYIIQTDQAIDVNLTGSGPNLSENASLALQVGWNLIGNPYNQSISLTDLVVTYRLELPVDWNTAVNQEIVGDGVFGYLFNNTIPHVLNYTPAAILEPGRAYWIRVLKPEGITLTFAPNRGRATGRSYKPPQWQMPITVHGPSDTRSTMTLIMDANARDSRDRFDREMPPPFGGGLRWVSIGANNLELMNDARKNAARQEWQLRLTSFDPNAEHRISWPAPPNRTRLYLIDEATGARHDMTTVREIRVAPGASREFKVVAEPLVRSPLRITTLTAQPTRGGSVSVNFTVTAASRVQAEIRDSRGRTVKRLQAGRSVEAGAQSLVWSGRDDRERALPPGGYFVHLQAVDSGGAVARAVAPVVVSR